MKIFAVRCSLSILFAVLVSSPGFSGEARSPSSSEWERTIEPAKKEGKLVAAIPASAELRKAVGESFPRRFPGIELDLTNARGPSNAGKIAAEHAAGVRYYDLLISGTATPFSLLNAGILEPVEPLLLLPEVKDSSIGSAAISGSTTPNDLSMRSRSISRKTSGIMRRC